MKLPGGRGMNAELAVSSLRRSLLWTWGIDRACLVC